MADRFAPDKDWRDYTACSPKDADLFFLDVGESPRQALELCAVCVVRADCLEYALTAKPAITRGVWGGKTERQLRHLRQERVRSQRDYEQDQARRNGELPGCICGAPDEPYPTGKFVFRHSLGIMGVPKSTPCEAARRCRRLSNNAIAAKARERKRAMPRKNQTRNKRTDRQLGRFNCGYICPGHNRAGPQSAPPVEPL